MCNIANPDVLHTLKGVMTSVMNACINCVQYCGFIDSKYAQNMAKIDDWMLNCTVIHSHNLFQHCSFKGISEHCGGSKGKGRKTTVAKGSVKVLTGSIEAWKIPTLILQLMAAIGEDGEVVPNTSNWSQENYLHRAWNPTEIICNAIGMILDLQYLVSAKEMIEFNRSEIDAVAFQVQCHLNLLQWMNQDLSYRYEKKLCVNKFMYAKQQLQRAGNQHPADEQINNFAKRLFKYKNKNYVDWSTCIDPEDILKDSKPYPRCSKAQKPHLIENYGTMKFYNGANCLFWDTELSELFHNEVVKLPFQSSSKRFGESKLELLKIHLKRKNQNKIEMMMKKRYDHIGNVSFRNRPEKPFAGFIRVKSTQSQRIIFDYDANNNSYIHNYESCYKFIHPGMHAPAYSYFLGMRLIKYAESCTENQHVKDAILDLMNNPDSENKLKLISHLKCESTIDESTSERGSQNIIVQSFKDKHVFMNTEFEEVDGTSACYLTHIWALLELDIIDHGLVYLALAATMVNMDKDRYIPYDKVSYLKDDQNHIECNIIDVQTFDSGAVVYPTRVENEYISIPNKRMFPIVNQKYTDILHQVTSEWIGERRFNYMLNREDVASLVSVFQNATMLKDKADGSIDDNENGNDDAALDGEEGKDVDDGDEGKEEESMSEYEDKSDDDVEEGTQNDHDGEEGKNVDYGDEGTQEDDGEEGNNVDYGDEGTQEGYAEEGNRGVVDSEFILRLCNQFNSVVE